MSQHHARVPVATTTAAAPAAPQNDAPAAATALRPAAASLTVGSADDRAEHAADALADSALSRLDGVDPHRHTPGCGHLRRSFGGASGTVGAAGGALDGDLTGRIEAARAGGTALPAPVRRRMEDAFGTNLGHVRVHTGPEAGRLSSALSAEAFSTGDDIFFGPGRFAPHDPVGEKVLAHEIAHVVQETGSTAVRRWSNPFKKIFGSKKDTPPTPEEQKAQAVKESKQAEKAELQALAADRAKGVAGRADLQEKVNGAGPGADPGKDLGSWKRMNGLWAQFDKALAYEVRTYNLLLDRNPTMSPEVAAQEAYDSTWHGRFAELEAIRPPRETAAERLMVQVRAARQDSLAHDRELEAEEDTIAGSRLMPTEVEDVYDRMVAAAAALTAADPDLHPQLARDRAARQVRDGLVPKLAGRLPLRNSPVDREAWSRAEERAPALASRRARQGAAVASNLDTLSGYADKAQSIGGKALKGVDTAGGKIAGKFTPELKKSPGGSDVNIPGTGGVVDAVSRASWRKKNGVSSDDDYQKLADDPLKHAGGQAKEGISTITGILGGLLTAVKEAFAAARSARDAWKQKDPYGALSATKSGAASIGGLVSAAKSTANLAKLIDSGVANGVAKVVPGLDIAASAISMVQAVTDVAVAGMRQHETDVAMFEARAARTGPKVNVMVWPLMNVSRTYTKNLENTTWALGSSVADLGLSIGQVASGGGFGIPAAIKAAKTVLDGVHSLGHFIADEVFVVQAQTAERESAVQHLEGGAEAELRKHPKAAVDGIILRAAAGDAVARAFLANYRIDGEPIGPAMLDKIRVKPVTAHDPRRKAPTPTGAADIPDVTTDDGALAEIRAAVLESMGTDADPQTVYERAREAMTSVVGTGAGVRDRWNRSGALATQRNTMKAGAEANGGKVREDRGFFWRVRQTLKGEEHLGRKERMTTVLAAQGGGAPVAGLVVGSAVLAPDATPPDFAAFIDSITVEDIEAELAATPQRNSPEMVDVLLELLQRKLTEAATP